MTVRISASKAGAVLGVSPHMKRDQVLRSMVRQYHRAEKETRENPAITHGLIHEGNALMAYHLETGREAIKNTDRFKHGIYLAEPDALVYDHETESWGCLECKCPFGIRFDFIPKFKTICDLDHYYAQAQLEMMCTGTTWCDFFQWTPHGRQVERVHVDDRWLGMNLPALQAFHEEFLIACMTPEMHLLPPLKRYNNVKLRRLVEEYDQMNEAILSAQSRQCELLKDIIDLTKGGEAEVCGKMLLQHPSDPGYGSSLKSKWSLSK